MATPLQNIMTQDGPSVFYTEHVRHELEMNIEVLKNGNEAYMLNIEANVAFVYEGDLYGLLKTKKIPAQYHWITGRVNGYSSSFDYTSDRTTLLIPDFSIIERIKATHTTLQTMV